MQSIVDEDFDDFKKYLIDIYKSEEKYIIQNQLKFRKIHQISYSFLLLNKILKKDNQASVFFDEIISDYIELVPLIVQGYIKLSRVVLRDILENCFKYIYYSDHPVEFTWLTSKEKYFVTIEEFLKYLEDHPIIGSHIKKLELTSKIRVKYYYLSKYVHAKNKKYMQVRKCLQLIKSDRNLLPNFYSEFEEISKTVMLLIILYEHDNFIQLDINKKRIVYDSIGKKYKKYILSL